MIFVCEDGTSIGPMAKAIFQRENTKIRSECRGIVALFPEPVNPKVVAVLKCNNLELDVETSLPLKEEDFEKNTLVLAMTKEQKEKIYENFPSAQNVYTLKEFAGESGDVINPYGEPLTGYGACYEELNRLIKKILSY